MSGHSKWSQIKHKKAAADARRGVLFGKLARAISIAARGNPDPETNLRLKAEVERARAANMPNDSIERAIRRVSEKDADQLKELELAFMGPAGTGIRVHAITDNSNRTINELKQLASRSGARMVEPAAIAWMFADTNPVTVPLTNQTDRETLRQFLDVLREHDDVQDVSTNAEL